jgi:hypothetical protein
VFNNKKINQPNEKKKRIPESRLSEKRDNAPLITNNNANNELKYVFFAR